MLTAVAAVVLFWGHLLVLVLLPWCRAWHCSMSTNKSDMNWSVYFFKFQHCNSFVVPWRATREILQRGRKVAKYGAGTVLLNVVWLQKQVVADCGCNCVVVSWCRRLCLGQRFRCQWFRARGAAAPTRPMDSGKQWCSLTGALKSLCYFKGNFVKYVEKFTTTLCLKNDCYNSEKPEPIFIFFWYRTSQ